MSVRGWIRVNALSTPVSVVLRAASTAIVVEEKLFSGPEPSGCPVSVARGSPFNIKTRVGGEVNFSDIEEWLRQRVHPPGASW